MQPKNFKFGGGLAETILNPVVLILILIAGVIILTASRKKIIPVFISAALLIPIDQVLVLFGVHFPMLRVLALFGIVRLLREKFSKKKQILSGGLNKVDISVILLALTTAVAGVALFQETGALVYQVGNLYTVFGVYFLLRFLLYDADHVVYMIRALAWCAAFIAVIMIWETKTGHNPYALLGGADASNFASLAQRAGRFRAQGCFAHSILAGTFGAILLPLMLPLWQSSRKNRLPAAVGVVATLVITVTSNSSTPMLAYASGVIALCLWPIRDRLRLIRWGLVVLVVSLHMVMKAPVWHLIARIDISGGSSSDHRFQLIDQCIRHFGDWWLVGVKSTFEWGWDMFDTANQYVSICDNSGLLAFIFFMAVLVFAFKFVGRARRAARTKRQKWFNWALGASLFANTVAFVGVSYWDQIQVVWYTILACVCASALTVAKDLRIQVDKAVEPDLPVSLDHQPVGAH